MSKLDEMNSAAGVAVQGAPGKTFKVDSAAVYTKNKKKKDPKKPFKVASLQETVLRQAIRTILFNSKMDFYEKKTQEYIQEQKLRGVIRKLLSEKSDMAPYNSTGLNVAAETFQRIRRTIADAYKSLTTNIAQRQEFIRTVVDMVKKAVEQQDLMKKIESGEATPAQASMAIAGTAPAAPSAPIAEAEEAVQTPAPAIPLEPQQDADQKSQERAKQIASQVAKKSPDTTGGRVAGPVVATIVPQILAARDTLKEPNDLKIFDLAIIGGNGSQGNIEALADVAEKELAAALGSSDQTATPAPAEVPAPSPQTDINPQGV